MPESKTPIGRARLSPVATAPDACAFTRPFAAATAAADSARLRTGATLTVPSRRIAIVFSILGQPRTQCRRRWRGRPEHAPMHARAFHTQIGLQLRARLLDP